MHNKKNQVSRRDFVKGTGSAAIAVGAGLGLQSLQPARAQDNQKFNILMILTDQERHMTAAQMPSGYRLPAHEKLASRGVVFENHQVASCVCTPSRSVIYTGQHIQNNGMFDNTIIIYTADHGELGGAHCINGKGWRPDMEKRGAIRSVFDGRYKLSRYFSPQQHHMPRTIGELYANNDIELFDLVNDPNEMVNLAMDRKTNGDLLLAMNGKLNALIEDEVGEDIGQMLPGGADADWTLDPSISNLRM
jgi:arylsulfatase A-like enzyme